MNLKLAEIINWCTQLCQQNQISFVYTDNESFATLSFNAGVNLFIYYTSIPPQITNGLHYSFTTWQQKQHIIAQQILKHCNKLPAIFARKCVVKRIDKQTAQDFLNQHHLLGYCNAYYKIALYYNQELVMIALFSKARKMQENYPVPFRSYELVRVCSKSNVVVTGGLSKLVKYFCNTFHAKHIMTYINGSMHNGKAFEQIGFIQQPHSDVYHNKKYILNLL